MNYAIGAILASVALLLGVWGVLLVYRGFQPAPDSPYALIGAGLLLSALLFALGAWWSFTLSYRPVGGVILVVLGMVATALLTRFFGDETDDAIRVALIILVVGAVLTATRRG